MWTRLGIGRDPVRSLGHGFWQRTCDGDIAQDANCPVQDLRKSRLTRIRGWKVLWEVTEVQLKSLS